MADPKIKLFGKTIELQETAAKSGGAVSSHSCDVAGDDSSNQEPPCSSDSMLQDNNLDANVEDQDSPQSAKHEEQAKSMMSDDLSDSNATQPTIKDSNETSSTVKMKNDEEQNEKTLKKPDKILPCPRCNSMDTKFCYFNNYNVNQPRHFCKNCQRYWTAGGTMRNVPVGAGRRKNKSQFRHMSISEALSNGIHHPASNPNGTVLTFGSDLPLCKSLASVLNIADRNSSTNTFHKPEGGLVSDGGKQNGDNHPTKDEAGKNMVLEMIPSAPAFPPCYPGGPWPYPWFNSSVSPSTFGPTNFPMPFYSTPPPPSYWGCAVPGPWPVPWVIPSQGQTPPCSGPNSPTLGKHSRDDNVVKPGNAEEKEGGSEKSLWVPKTLRINDPGEAAKSSIWATLGIKDDRTNSGGSGLFKAFRSQSKGEEKAHVLETSTVLQANPAALSRSLNFHESS